MRSVEITDLQDLQRILANSEWKRDPKTARAVWNFVRSKRIDALTEVEAPSSRDGVEQISVTDEAITALTARVRATSEHGGRFFGHWEPPKPKSSQVPMPASSHTQPMLPMVWFSPALAQWVSEVVVRALRERPLAWATILRLPDRESAKQLSEIIASRVPEMEIAVRDESIWGRWSGAA